MRTILRGVHVLAHVGAYSTYATPTVWTGSHALRAHASHSRSYSVCWVWCSQPRSYWWPHREPWLGRWPSSN